MTTASVIHRDPARPEPRGPARTLAGRRLPRLVPPLDTMPSVVRFGTTPGGKCVVLVVFGLLLHATKCPAPALTMAFLSCAAFFPAYRRPIVTAAALAWVGLGIETFAPDDLLGWIARSEGAPGAFDHWFAPVLGAGGALLTFSLLVAAAARVPAILRSPVMSLLAIDVSGIAVARSGLLSGYAQAYLWAAVLAFNWYIWYFAYSLRDLSLEPSRRTPFLHHFGLFRPFWGGTAAPWPKGATYVAKIEAKTPAALAICQLKAVKLLLWALILTGASIAMNVVLHGGSRRFPIPHIDVPRMWEAVAASAAGNPLPAALNWLALITGFVEKMIEFTIHGHVVIAVCRMAGFGALRNTYRPLESRTIADFWNRINYYFKELFAELFFYPAFLGYFKAHPRLRLLFATFVAAGLGNLLFHYLVHVDRVVKEGFLPAALSFRTYAVYALVLSIGIGVSQLRRRRPLTTRASRIRATLVVLSFYCFLGLLDGSNRSLTLEDRLGFLLDLIR